MTDARASDSMFLSIDFVRVTNCFYDYDYYYFLVPILIADWCRIIQLKKLLILVKNLYSYFKKFFLRGGTFSWTLNGQQTSKLESRRK